MLSVPRLVDDDRSIDRDEREKLEIQRLRKKRVEPSKGSRIIKVITPS